jgi:uncharacterized protein (TIGR03437 family)
VVAQFSNGDPPLTLTGDSLGVYSATWQPGIAAAQTTISIRASAGTLLPALTQLSGSATENPNAAPSLAKAGTLNNLNPVVGAALAPGAVAQVYGSRLADAVATPTSLPLPETLNGTEIIVGGLSAPIYYSSPTQLSVQIPNELLADREYPIIAVVNGALSVPDTVRLTPVGPGVAAFPDGGIIAQHGDFSLIDANNPAHPAEPVVMYLVGMGSTTATVKSGAVSPGSPLAYTSVQPTVTVDGQTAEILFAGLTPGGIGLYQINFRVPAAARTGRLEIVVKQGAATANTTYLIVAP